MIIKPTIARFQRTVITSLLVVFAILAGCQPGDTGVAGKSENIAYDRVIADRVIRVGYVPYPPGLIKDPNSGELSGIFFDTFTNMGEVMDIEIEWQEEVTWGTMIEGLKTGRYDVIGSPVWASASRGTVADFTVPLFYSGIGAYVRADSELTVDALDNADVRISTIDGEMSSIIASADYPTARQVPLPQLSDVSQLLLEVSEGKADVAFVEPYQAQQFMESHGPILKNIAADRPLRVFSNSMMVNKSEPNLKSMLDIAINEQKNMGIVEVLVSEYAGSADAFYLSAFPYRRN